MLTLAYFAAAFFYWTGVVVISVSVTVGLVFLVLVPVRDWLAWRRGVRGLSRSLDRLLAGREDSERERRIA